MSTSSSNNSFFSTSTSDASLSPHKFTNLILDDATIPLLEHAFRNDPITHAHLRHYNFVSSEIKQLEHTLDRHFQERQTLFHHIMKFGKVERTMKPVVDSYRRRKKAKGFHPYSQRPLTPFHRPSRPPRPSIVPRLSPPSTNHDSKPSSSQQSSSSSVKMGQSDDDLILAYLQLQGTPHNPITLNGSDNWLPQCDRCKQYGHAKQDCNTPLWSFLFCEVCKWKRTPQDNCPHFNMSPVVFKALRGNIPYDEDA